MKKLSALIMLIVNFFKSLLFSAWDTARIILFEPKTTNSGIATLKYEDLPVSSVIVLSNLITLTPGTSVVDVDIESKQLTLHFLDLNQFDETVDKINRDFIKYLTAFNGEQS